MKNHGNKNGIQIPVNSYYNYKACKNCKYKEQCLSGTTTNRIIQEQGLELSIKMKYKMNTEK